MPQFNPETFIAAVERERATHTMMVPSQIVAMLNSPAFSPDSLKSMEAISSIGAPLHLEHREKLTELLPDCFYELYGLTEGFMTVLDKYDYQSKSGSVGVPLPFFEMKIVNEDGREVQSGKVGEITGRSPLLMTEYYKQPELTGQAFVNGWLHTGDLGYLDKDDFLFLVDRKKYLIISGGINIFPKYIEEIIVRHPAVRGAAVFWGPER